MRITYLIALLQLEVEVDEERYRSVATPGDFAQVLVEQGAEGLRLEVGGKLGLQLVGVGKRELFGVGLDEKVERIDHRELGGQIDLDAKFLDLFRKHVARQPVAMRILLPIDEVQLGLDLERIAGDFCPAVRRGSQADRLWAERDRAVVGVAGGVIKTDQYRQWWDSLNDLSAQAGHAISGPRGFAIGGEMAGMSTAD